MRLADVTNSHSRLVSNQPEDTDAHLVRVYTAGDTTIVCTEAPEHNEISLINDKRKTQLKEIEEARGCFLGKIKGAVHHEDRVKVIELAGLVEISAPEHELDVMLAV